MEKKRSVGVTIFAVFLIIFGLASLVAGVLSHGEIIDLQQYPYRAAYKGAIEQLDEMKDKEAEIKDDRTLYRFRRDFDEFKTKLENFKQKYIVRQAMAPLLKSFFYLSFACTVLYIISGIAIFRLHPFARNIVFITVSLSLSLKFYAFWIGYYTFKPIEVILIGTLNLVSYFVANFEAPSSIISSPLQIFTGLPVARNIVIGYFVLSIAYVIFVFYFFTRPKVKEQFK